MLYKVRVVLDETYDDIEADSEEEAFQIASQCAIEGGAWGKEIEELEKKEIYEDFEN